MRLIDADALEKLITEEEMHRWHDDYSQGRFDGAQSCLDLIHDAPTIDAVPVARCRECMHRYYYEEDIAPVCTAAMAYANTPDDWFCKDGERREEEHNG